MLAAIWPTLYVAAVTNGQIQSLTLNTKIIEICTPRLSRRAQAGANTWRAVEGVMADRRI